MNETHQYGADNQSPHLTPVHLTTPRAEYPRPQFVRDEWLNLNGKWEFDYDDGDVGLAAAWYLEHEFAHHITVPFTYQSKLSGLQDNTPHDIVWYRRSFELPRHYEGKRLLLHFGAVDYEADVWMNGTLLGRHEGGHTPFTLDATYVCKSGENAVVVRTYDPVARLDQPRGKQYWQTPSASIFYTRTTGIWQTVWLEPVSQVHIDTVRFTPDVDKDEVGIEIGFAGLPYRFEFEEEAGHRNDAVPVQAPSLDIAISFAGKAVAMDSCRLTGSSLHRVISLSDFNVHNAGRLWSPEHPNLYDVTLTLRQAGHTTAPTATSPPAPESQSSMDMAPTAAADVPIDVMRSYFGMRKISIEDGRVFLNNRPYYMKLVLDQGYFPDGVLTAPTDDAFRRDVELTKAMGFNGVRKHQKPEDPRFLYWCDKLGLLVWGEMANCATWSTEGAERLTREWLDVIRRDYSHPCIVTWVPINESWGVPRLLTDKRQQHHTQAMYHMTKSLDATRLVMSNDGWEHTKSDLCTIHDYEGSREVLEDRYASVYSSVTSLPAGRFIYVSGYHHDGEPILLTEFGGIAFKKSEWDGWGYTGASSDEDFIRRYEAVVAAVLHSEDIQGFCYTQLTDVEQEINGLLTYDRRPKVPLEIIRAINEGRSVDKADANE